MSRPEMREVDVWKSLGAMTVEERRVDLNILQAAFSLSLF